MPAGECQHLWHDAALTQSDTTFCSAPQPRESDASFERQQELRRQVMTELVVGAFDTPEKLASAVTRALFVWHEEQRQAEETTTTVEGQATKPAPVGRSVRPKSP